MPTKIMTEGQPTVEAIQPQIEPGQQTVDSVAKSVEVPTVIQQLNQKIQDQALSQAHEQTQDPEKVDLLRLSAIEQELKLHKETQNDLVNSLNYLYTKLDAIYDLLNAQRTQLPASTSRSQIIDVQAYQKVEPSGQPTEKPAEQQVTLNQTSTEQADTDQQSSGPIGETTKPRRTLSFSRNRTPVPQSFPERQVAPVPDSEPGETTKQVEQDEPDIEPILTSADIIRQMQEQSVQPAQQPDTIATSQVDPALRLLTGEMTVEQYEALQNPGQTASGEPQRTARQEPQSLPSATLREPVITTTSVSDPGFNQRMERYIKLHPNEPEIEIREQYRKARTEGGRMDTALLQQIGQTSLPSENASVRIVSQKPTASQPENKVSSSDSGPSKNTQQEVSPRGPLTNKDPQNLLFPTDRNKKPLEHFSVLPKLQKDGLFHLTITSYPEGPEKNKQLTMLTTGEGTTFKEITDFYGSDKVLPLIVEQAVTPAEQTNTQQEHDQTTPRPNEPIDTTTEIFRRKVRAYLSRNPDLAPEIRKQMVEGTIDTAHINAINATDVPLDQDIFYDVTPLELQIKGQGMPDTHTISGNIGQTPEDMKLTQDTSQKPENNPVNAVAASSRSVESPKQPEQADKDAQPHEQPMPYSPENNYVEKIGTQYGTARNNNTLDQMYGITQGDAYTRIRQTLIDRGNTNAAQLLLNNTHGGAVDIRPFTVGATTPDEIVQRFNNQQTHLQIIEWARRFSIPSEQNQQQPPTQARRRFFQNPWQRRS